MPPTPQNISPRPMRNVNAAMSDLDLDEDKVRALVDQGFLTAFNIVASKDANRTELRILTKSIEYFRETGGKLCLNLEWPEIFRIILPQPDKLLLRGTEIQGKLNCSSEHVLNLIRCEQLTSVKTAHSGRNGSPIVTRESFQSFLIGRLL